ncbi:nucleotidyltransferase domain-containing protein [Anaerocolumna xylanovorans]|uniref:Uncharacterized nucleotidyltransferase n=1 Tax=Anaerocolumna xylanovorans DSM 12503 TaxID=1121345 RepID=A0A1M7YAI4_9FIRM|nr:nucleotidyltransferase family protein [Anaerocolumna xylanovorans]SHO49586.1 Uncharacterised nucleotidyltransferase [Anaerocolumna xylanovorans DSM 12503]
MNEHSHIFIKLLSAAISVKAPDFLTFCPDWNLIYEEAKAHQVHTLLFPLLEELPKHVRPSPSLLESWKYDTLREAALQLLHIEQMEKVLLLLHEASIPVIALKGLMLRNYYPNPELRTMGDADILIHKEDFKKAHKVLVFLGYKRGKSAERHTTYSLTGYPDIELHEILTDNTDMENLNHFTFQVWKNAVPGLVGHAPVLCLSIKDQLMHQLFHIIHHVLLSGVGIRQLCDLTLFAAYHSEEIIWENILYELEPYGYDKFTLVLLSICRELFGLSVPEDILTEEDVEFCAYKALFTEDIINSGVYGKRTKEREASRHILWHARTAEAVTAPSPPKLSVLLNLCCFFFPSPGKLNCQYRYAKKFPVLLPLAWIHRAFYNIRQLSLLSFFYNKEAAAAYAERAALLSWLKLR